MTTKTKTKPKGIQTWAGDGVLPPDEKRRLKAEKDLLRAEKARLKKIADAKAARLRAAKDQLRLLKKKDDDRRKRDREYKAQKRKQAKEKAEREKREIEIGCARFDYTKVPYGDKFIVQVTGVSDLKHLSEYELFLDEKVAELSFRTPGEDDPMNPFRLPILRKFKNAEFKILVGGRPWMKDEYDQEEGDELFRVDMSSLELTEIPEAVLIHPHYFRIGLYCDAVE